MGRSRRRGNARRCSKRRSRLASATIRPSSSWSGPGRRAARRWSPPCSRRRDRPSAIPARTSMSVALQGSLVLAGAGKMGGALLAGWLERGLDPNRVLVQDPAPLPEVVALLARHGMRTRPSIAGLAEPPAVMVMAVKPQVMED